MIFPISRRAICRSKSFCKLSQRCGEVPRALPKRRAVSAVILTSSDAIRSTRVRGTPILLASAPADNLSGTRNSSRRTSLGCMGESFLVIGYLVRFPYRLRSATPLLATPENHPANAVPCDLCREGFRPLRRQKRSTDPDNKQRPRGSSV